MRYISRFPLDSVFHRNSIIREVEKWGNFYLYRSVRWHDNTVTTLTKVMYSVSFVSSFGNIHRFHVLWNEVSEFSRDFIAIWLYFPTYVNMVYINFTFAGRYSSVSLQQNECLIHTTLTRSRFSDEHYLFSR